MIGVTIEDWIRLVTGMSIKWCLAGFATTMLFLTNFSMQQGKINDVGEFVRLRDDCLAKIPVDSEGGYYFASRTIILWKDDIYGVNEKRLIGIDSFVPQRGKRSLEFTFLKSGGGDDYVKVGDFGGKSYRLKNLVSRIREEDVVDTVEPIQIKVYSKGVVRGYKLMIVFDLWDTQILEEGIVIEEGVSDKLFEEVIVLTGKESRIGEIESDVDIESRAVYEKYMLPRALAQNKNWVYDIFSGVKRETILYNSTEFIMVPDSLWVDKNVSNLHCIAFYKNLALMSIRDLRVSDIPLMKNIINIGMATIAKVWYTSDIKTYFHYYPSVWQCHIHFATDNMDMKHIRYMTDDVIKNLESNSDYYRDATLVI
ncbi:MAG: m7GpppX diphosphatase [Hyperionvirus sp.]|uniref:M7GpppX diphosphatase n=1 Tax=Hyperionvirus sp. TaxID=2487770 RepID=A0A3G5A9P8_9VIRU|nr:MAG: m7GpppX diphosphatase [Hyperionvirus sp.]